MDLGILTGINNYLKFVLDVLLYHFNLKIT